jgi:hypothetical protein
MKKCIRCGAPWKSFRAQPNSRDVCEICGAHLHSCVNCIHFDREVTSSCKLPHTAFVGSREAINYCDDFKMIDSFTRAREEKISKAKLQWEALWKT